MNQLKEKKLNNKGFSLVELIIVIAIMAVLIGVLAPQYMRYVEKSRLAKDNDIVDSVKTAVEVALTDNTIYNDVMTAGGAVIAFDATNGYNASGVTSLDTELGKVVTPANCKLSSKTYSSTKPDITVSTSGDNITVTVNNYKESPN